VLVNQTRHYHLVQQILAVLDSTQLVAQLEMGLAAVVYFALQVYFALLDSQQPAQVWPPLLALAGDFD
jgi:predicted metal-dependent HD superfamily phosphohydrolase